MNTPVIVAALISEDPDDVKEFYAAVAVTSHDNKWLLGLSKAEDDRRDKWCFPGGGIKERESPVHAAARECREETGVVAHPVGGVHTLPDKPGVAFVRCRADKVKLKPNHEFTALGWFSRCEMKALRLYHNVYKLLDKLT